MYDTVHPIRFLTQILKPQDCLGEIDPSTLPELDEEETEEVKRIQEAQDAKPPLRAMINVDDFEVSALCAFFIARTREENDISNIPVWSIESCPTHTDGRGMGVLLWCS